MHVIMSSFSANKWRCPRYSHIKRTHYKPKQTEQNAKQPEVGWSNYQTLQRENKQYLFTGVNKAGFRSLHRYQRQWKNRTKNNRKMKKIHLQILQ